MFTKSKVNDIVAYDIATTYSFYTRTVVRIYTQHSIAYTYREMAAGGIDTQYLDSNGEEVREMEDMVDDRGEVFPYMFEPETSEEEAGSDSDVEIDRLDGI